MMPVPAVVNTANAVFAVVELGPIAMGTDSLGSAPKSRVDPWLTVAVVAKSVTAP